MRIGIIADIHSNLVALQTVLDDIAKKDGVDEIWCLGDIVGYGPQPNECIDIVRKFCKVCVAGNHDLGAIGRIELSYFNPAAAVACEWTKERLNPIGLRFLQDLPMTAERDNFFIVHGSPAEPALEYIVSASIAQKNFEFFKSQFCLVGHSHEPAAFKEQESGCQPIRLMEGIGLVTVAHRMIINPGSVGQPRDGDPRASYAIYESEGQMLRLHRVEYDIRATQDRMMEARLPVQLITRLEQGR